MESIVSQHCRGRFGILILAWKQLRAMAWKHLRAMVNFFLFLLRSDDLETLRYLATLSVFRFCFVFFWPLIYFTGWTVTKTHSILLYLRIFTLRSDGPLMFLVFLHLQNLFCSLDEHSHSIWYLAACSLPPDFCIVLKVCPWLKCCLVTFVKCQLDVLMPFWRFR